VTAEALDPVTLDDDDDLPEVAEVMIEPETTSSGLLA